MPDDKLYPPEVMAPVQIAMIGTGDGGIQTGTAVTSASMPNLAVTVITPMLAIAVRFANQFLTTLVGLVAAGLTPAGDKLLQATDFFDLVVKCATLSVAGAGLGTLKDFLTIFSKLETKFPLLSGSV